MRSGGGGHRNRIEYIQETKDERDAKNTETCDLLPGFDACEPMVTLEGYYVSDSDHPFVWWPPFLPSLFFFL